MQVFLKQKLNSDCCRIKVILYEMLDEDFAFGFVYRVCSEDRQLDQRLLYGQLFRGFFHHLRFFIFREHAL